MLLLIIAMVKPRPYIKLGLPTLARVCSVPIMGPWALGNRPDLRYPCSRVSAIIMVIGIPEAERDILAEAVSERCQAQRHGALIAPLGLGTPFVSFD